MSDDFGTFLRTIQGKEGEMLQEQTDAQLRGLGEVRIKKDDLLEIVQKNADEHRQIFEEALDGWHKAVTKSLQEAYDDAKAGRGYKIDFGLQRPQEHTKQYAQVIKMLELSQDDELELTYQEFAQYVMDEWGWQAAFLTTSSQYGSTTSEAKLNRMNNAD